MDWQQPELKDDGSVKIPATWLYNHYYEALNALFRIENSLRTFVFIVLKDNKKLAWTQLSLKTEDGNETTIESIAKRRLSQDRVFGYLGYPIASPLMHLTSGELIRIILSDAYWPMFSKHFPAQREIVQTKLEEIGNVRNALAHFRPIARDDVQVVKQNANQVLSGVESLLVSVVNCIDNIPTNSKHAWYKNLKMLSGPYVQLQFNQSIDTKWVRIGIKYACPTVSTPSLYEKYRSYKVLTINTPRILIDSKTILPNVIFVSEQIPYTVMPADGIPSFSKTVRLLFSPETLADKHEELKKELEELLARITNETDLIKEDNLARGDIVQGVSVSASRDAETPWQIDSRNLRSPSSNNDPSEYWAGHPFWGTDFLSNTESFPWMPVKIAEMEFPF